MEILKSVLGYKEYLISPFSLKSGDIKLLLMPSGKDVKVCEELSFKAFDMISEPYWVKFKLEKINKNSILILNDNINYLRTFLTTEFNSYTKFSRENLRYLSGCDIMLINMFLMRKLTGIVFFEINMAVISIDSIKRMLRFLLAEINESNNETAYLIVVPQDIMISTENPISIYKDNIEEIYKQYFYDPYQKDVHTRQEFNLK